MEYEPAFYVKLRSIASMEEFQAGLQLAIEKFNDMHSHGNETPHLHLHNETSKAAVMKFGVLVLEVFNSGVEVEEMEEGGSHFV